MRIEDLGSTYLGAVSFRALASAGRVAEQTSGALRSADAMFSSSEAPWCPWIF
jgi:predicted acetyltransferase